ncbi:MAG: GNAT family N-acetyltransferase [Anaerolineae bacterium]
MDDALAPIADFLRRDTLRNIVHLKMLQAYPDDIRGVYVEDGASGGALLLLPTRVSPYDTATYPVAKYVVLLSATDVDACAALLPHIPADCPWVFKGDTREREVLTRSFRTRRVTSFVSFTARPGAGYPANESVVVSDEADERCLAIYAEHGYGREAVLRQLAAGEALSLTVTAAGTLAAVCLTFLNFAQVWEIGGLHTLDAFRRQGHARRLVSTALNHLLARGFLPRYQVHEDNLPSIHLAESLGLERFLTIEHHLYAPP